MQFDDKRRKLITQILDTGIAYCVSTASIEDMVWAFEFAEKMNCSALQFHPFAATGRGEFLYQFELDKLDRTRAYTIATLLESNKEPSIHIDLLPTKAILNRQYEYVITAIESAKDFKLSNLVNPIVINDNGKISPTSFGLHSNYKIGGLGEELKAEIAHWKESQWFVFKDLIQTSFQKIQTQETDFIDWFYHIVKIGKSLQTDNGCK